MQAAITVRQQVTTRVPLSASDFERSLLPADTPGPRGSPGRIVIVPRLGADTSDKPNPRGDDYDSRTGDASKNRIRPVSGHSGFRNCFEAVLRLVNMLANEPNYIRRPVDAGKARVEDHLRDPSRGLNFSFQNVRLLREK